MKIVLLSCLLISVLVQRCYSVVVASEADFKVDCGSDVGGPISVIYTNSNPGPNKVVKISSPQNKPSCVGTETPTGVFTISDVRNNCNILQIDPSKPEYFLQIAVQEIDGIYQSSDPTFVFTCSYSVDKVTLTNTAVQNGGAIGGTPTTVLLASSGEPDMEYTLSVADTSLVAVADAKFGDTVILLAKMNGTDTDENGIRVEACNATSGGVTRKLIEDYCVVQELSSLFTVQGFVSFDLQATFQITLFALEGSTSNEVQFNCVVQVCPTSCIGINCPTTGRKRRAAEDEEPEEKSLTMATRIQVLPIGIPTSNELNQSGQQDVSGTCMQSLGFIVTVAVLAVLLLVALVTVVFMFTTRRRELQKQGA